MSIHYESKSASIIKQEGIVTLQVPRAHKKSTRQSESDLIERFATLAFEENGTSGCGEVGWDTGELGRGLAAVCRLLMLQGEGRGRVANVTASGTIAAAQGKGEVCNPLTGCSTLI